MTDIKLPMFGAVPRGPFIVSAVLAAGVGGYFLWKHHQNAAAPAPATGYGYGMGYGYGAGYGLGIASFGYGYGMAYGGGSGGITSGGGAGSVPAPVDPGGGNTGTGTGTGTGSGGTATTNPQWASEAKGALQTAGMNPATVSAALQLYINGKTVTQDQAQIVQSAINAVGYPPVPGKNNYPPQIHVSGGGGTGQNPGSGKGQIVGKRHVATGTASMVTWAKNNKTGTGEIENTTEQNYQSGFMTSENHNKFTAYLNKGTSSKMPTGLVFFSTH